MSGEVLWRPTRKQAEFLAASELEVLYGGAAGGGKSDAMLIDALGLQQSGPLKARYRGLLIRRTFSELRGLMDRSRELYPRIVPGATFSESDKEWRFTSGAKVIFGYAERESDKYQYQGQEYTWIGLDELTQWPTDAVYEYLMTRLRAPEYAELKCYMRATCNPGGPGHEWVRKRFGITDAGGPSTVLNGHLRRFIPAKLDDNPYLSGTDYRARLAGLSEMQRRALLEGRWDVIEIPGQIYKQQITDAMVTGRIGNVPHEPTLPVHTFWDLGVGDATTIWFVQGVGKEIRLIDYYEASGEGLPHYVRVLSDKPYNYGDHYAPHDIEVRELSTGRSRREVAAGLGLHFMVTPKLGIEDGIEAVRVLFPRFWFDKERCKRGLETLTNYRREFNEKMGAFKPEPVHDWASHGADAFRYLAVAWNDAPTSAPRVIRSVDYA